MKAAGIKPTEKSKGKALHKAACRRTNTDSCLGDPFAKAMDLVKGGFMKQVATGAPRPGTDGTIQEPVAVHG